MSNTKLDKEAEEHRLLCETLVDNNQLTFSDLEGSFRRGWNACERSVEPLFLALHFIRGRTFNSNQPGHMDCYNAANVALNKYAESMGEKP